jgi:conjugative transfer pilus assembly protein TraH
MSAATAPGVYEGQTRGYMTGGGLSMRLPRANLNIGSASLPKIRAGCEGIDIYLGSFSYVNADQLIAKLKAIGAGALGYGFTLALESISPQIAGTIKFWESELNKVLNSNLSACQAARALVDATGLPEKIRASQIGRCAGARTASGSSVDYNAARQECAADPASGAVGDSEDQAVGRPDRNYLWEALNGLTGLDEISKELILSTIGTIVSANNRIDTWGGLIEPEMLLDGGEVRRYDCDVTCLSQNIVSETTTEGLVAMVRQRLLGILAGIHDRNTLSPSDIDFVSTAPFPLYRMVNALSSLPPAVAEAHLLPWAEPLALLMVRHWIDETARAARQALATARIESEVQKVLEERIKEVQEGIRGLMFRAKYTTDTILTEIQRLERLERAIAANLVKNDLAKAYAFGKTRGGR